ncbi:MAG: hypothetical protein ACO2O2_00285 [Acidilobaceae archaeon]
MSVALTLRESPGNVELLALGSRLGALQELFNLRHDITCKPIYEFNQVPVLPFL